jgi:DNA-binding MarR family transcriptional regulator
MSAAPPLAERLTFLIHTAGARIANVGNRHFREHDLNHFSARILVMLLEQGELRAGELVERMVLPQSTISSQLQVLHKKRLIRRRRSRQDNRAVILSLTPAGAELAGDCNLLSVRVHEAMIRGISERERKSGFAFLHKINRQLMALEQQELVEFHGVAQLQELADPGVAKPAARRAKAGRPTAT